MTALAQKTEDLRAAYNHALRALNEACQLGVSWAELSVLADAERTARQRLNRAIRREMAS